MIHFKIEPCDRFLTESVDAFYHSDYHGGDPELRNTIGTVENVICMLKNQFKDKNEWNLEKAVEALTNILKTDLPEILRRTGKTSMTVCVVPRAKSENFYSLRQNLFRKTVSAVVDELGIFLNGTEFILREKDTQTTHLKKSGYGGAGDAPYPGITKDTCSISPEVRGRDILLIDDLYTRTVNIDEDAIQALRDNGAESVVFYAVGRTLDRMKCSI